ncbi:MAG: methionyl-tRNA formyltransferase, partial [Deltaproteobacteria bacterium]|nr:methionyl-tRNA formyltransferase [Deltaproteobacteria bacterium]
LPDDTSETLHDRLADFGSELLINTIEGIVNNTITSVSQNHERATYAPLLKKSDGRIDWTKSAEDIEAFIRGMTPWPGAFTFYKQNRIKIFKVHVLGTDCDETAGTVVKGFQNEIRVATGNGTLSILELQSASGKRLSIEEYLKGHSIPHASVFN